jgi:hypothetical protein
MTAELVRKSKWFWGWEDDKEEAWLQEMARQGLHLKSPYPYGQYVFERGASREVAYRLDFVQSNKKTGGYFQIFRDAGWEYVGEMMGWQYWRKEIKAGEPAEIFTDVESKVQKYRRLLGFLIIFLSPALTGMFSAGKILEQHGHWSIVILGIIMFVLSCMFIYAFIRLWIRIRQLKRL